MDDRFTKAEAALLMPTATAASRREVDVEAIRFAAARARDKAIIAWLFGGLRAAARFVVSVPRRVATYNALSALSDRELRDIGMTRFDIGRVFDAHLTTRPANDAAKRPAPRVA